MGGVPIFYSQHTEPGILSRVSRDTRSSKVVEPGDRAARALDEIAQTEKRKSPRQAALETSTRLGVGTLSL